MILRMVTGVITMPVAIISCVIGICIAGLVGLQGLDRMWAVTPLVVIGTLIGAWLESKQYKQ